MNKIPAGQPEPGATSSPASAVAPGFEETVHVFWEQNRTFVLAACGVVLLGIVGWQAWEYISAARERGVQEEYAKVADDSAKLASFAATHSGHALAGVAYLRLADEKFAAADFGQAATEYQKAVGNLKNEALIGRARLGAAMSQVRAGDQAAGEAALKAVAGDKSVLKSVQAEANYHLATLALAAGRTDDARKLVEEVGKIDPAGAWNQRATMLMASLSSGAPAEPSTAPAITFKPGGK